MISPQNSASNLRNSLEKSQPIAAVASVAPVPVKEVVMTSPTEMQVRRLPKKSTWVAAARRPMASKSVFKIAKVPVKSAGPIRPLILHCCFAP
eukprot:9437469-Prorocentrum_lima.AAC.1